MNKLLFIDDDRDVLLINRSFFEKEGYEVKVTCKPQAIFSILEKYKPDCIILDIMMPEMNGLELCKKVKSKLNLPIIFLTGCSTENDKINGLLIGGDDYVIKPYSLRELSARIQVQIRRSSSQDATAYSISYPPLKLNLKQRTVFYNDEEVLLSKKEYDLLYLLVAHPNKVISFEEIGVHIWGSYLEADRRTIMVTASRLRKKFTSYAGESELIETVWGQGYVFHYKL